VNDRPVVLVETPDGGLDCLGLRFRTGEFDRMMECYEELDSINSWVKKLSREEFIQRVEACRGEFLKGDGPVYTLYEMINGLIEVPREQGQPLSGESKALVRSLRMKTHDLFEADLLARGLTGTPNEDGSLAVPVPVGPRSIPAGWQALSTPEVEDIVRRLLVLGEQLGANDAEATAIALGWPIVERSAHGMQLEAELPLEGASVWLTTDYGSLNLEIPTTMTVAGDTAEGRQFLSQAFDAASQACKNVVSVSHFVTGGRWPEWSWRAGGVGIFVRRGANYVELLAMSEEAAAIRYRAVQEDIEWGE
jgi:hypothetical protein